MNILLNLLTAGLLVMPIAAFTARGVYKLGVHPSQIEHGGGCRKASAVTLEVNHTIATSFMRLNLNQFSRAPNCHFGI